MVAMSGGVDSSVAALLLLEQGHDVTGVTLKLWDGPSDTGCCSVADVDDARRVASQLGIDYHVANMADEFTAHVVEPYVDAHRLGHTPNPCIECNRHLKFGSLLAMMDRLGFEALATGHHARIRSRENRVDLIRGVDHAKDQSYVLSMLSEEQLRQISLPVGEMTKAEVRQLALDRGLRTSMKPDSQDVCFIQSGPGRRGFLEERSQITPGEIIDAQSGEVVGAVDALELVTLGQRQGLGIDAEGVKRVAVRVDIAAKRVEVTTPERSLISELPLFDETFNWVHGPPQAESTRVIAQLRAHADPIICTLQGSRLIFDQPINPVAPGQTAAFYDVDDADAVLGSAIVAL
jgi:tRNA-specific 2-thiouridylase